MGDVEGMEPLGKPMFSETPALHYPVSNGGVFYCPCSTNYRAGNTSGRHVCPMLQDTRITLFRLAELVSTLRANDPDLFKRWLYGGIQDLGEPAVTELVLGSFF